MHIEEAGHGKPGLSGYNYGPISLLVLTADRSALPLRDKEPDGKPVLSGYNYSWLYFVAAQVDGG